MILLAHGCSCSELSVHPKNWQTKRASLDIQWYIHYRFYDPAFKDHPKYKGCKQVLLRSVNKFFRLQERQAAIEELLSNELHMLVDQQYNPITNTALAEEKKEYEIDPQTPLVEALRAVHKKVTATATTLSAMKTTISQIERAAIELRMISMPINSVSRRHIRALLDRSKDYGGGDTAYRFNKNRSYLMILFDQLMEFEATDLDPVTKIKKKKVVKKIRQAPNLKERALINEHLKANHFSFWRFIQIFFHSGARITELLSVKVEHVNLADQTYIVTLRKGKTYREVRKTIKNIALPLWTALLDGAPAEHFVFSKGLLPGEKTIRREQIVRRWKMHVKDKLGISADLYSLKHVHTTELIDQLSEQDAARMNSHEGVAMVKSIYDLQSERRQHERLKGASNEF